MSERAVKTLFSMLMVCTMQIVSSDESFKSHSILTFRSPKQKLHSVFSKKKKKERKKSVLSSGSGSRSSRSRRSRKRISGVDDAYERNS